MRICTTTSNGRAFCTTHSQAAVRAAAALLAFSSSFHDDKKRVLLEAGVRFAATGADVRCAVACIQA